MRPGAIEVVAYQETLLLLAVFGIAVLAMLWAAFRRWLKHKEKLERLFAEQAAERSAQHGAQMERVEARLDAIEQAILVGGSAHIEGRSRDFLAPSDMTRSGD